MSAKFTLEGSGQGAIDLIRKLNKELDGTEDQFDKAAKGAGRAEAAAKRLVDNVATPMERYKDKVEKLATAVEAGYITQEKAKVAADRYCAILQKTDPKMVEAAKRQEQFKLAAEKSAQAQKRAAEETAKASEALRAHGDKIKQSVETPMERYKRQLLEVGRLYRQGAIDQETFIRKARELKQEITVSSDAFKEVEVAQKSAFGSSAIASLGAYAAGMLSIGSVIAGIKQGFVELERQAQESADKSFGAFASMAQLQQVSSTPEEFAANVGFARSLVDRGIVSEDQQGMAADIAYALAGADFTDAEKELVARAGAAGFIKPEDMATIGEAMRTYQRAFGEGEAGSLAEIFDKGIIGGKATKVDTTKTLLAATKFGAGSRTLGFSDEESLAALVANEFQSENIDIAATQVSSLYDQLVKRGLGKGSLQETIAAIGERVQGGENIFSILGESRAVKGYEALAQNPQLFADSIANMQGAGGAFAASEGMVNQDPILAAQKAKREAEGRLEADKMNLYAEREALVDALAADIKQRAGLHSFTAYNAYFESGLNDVLGTDEGYMRSQLMRDDKSGGRLLSPEVRSRVEEYLERQAVAAERTADATERMERKQTTTTRQE